MKAMKTWLLFLFLITAVPGCSFDPLGLFPHNKPDVVDPDDGDDKPVITNWEDKAKDKAVFAAVVASWKGFDKSKVGSLSGEYYGLFMGLADEVEDNKNVDTAKKLLDLLAASGSSIGITKKANSDFSTASGNAIATLLPNSGDKITDDNRSKVVSILQSVACGCAAIHEGAK